jgi:hypothetical protein
MYSGVAGVLYRFVLKEIPVPFVALTTIGDLMLELGLQRDLDNGDNTMSYIAAGRDHLEERARLGDAIEKAGGHREEAQQCRYEHLHLAKHAAQKAAFAFEESRIPADAELEKMRGPAGWAFPSHDLSKKFWEWEHPADRPFGAPTAEVSWNVPPGEVVSFPFMISARYHNYDTCSSNPLLRIHSP